MEQIVPKEEKAAMILATTVSDRVSEPVKRIVEKWIEQASDDEDFASIIADMQGNLPEAMISLAVIAATATPKAIKTAIEKGNVSGLMSVMTTALDAAERITAIQDRLSKGAGAKQGIEYEVGFFNREELERLAEIIADCKRRTGR